MKFIKIIVGLVGIAVSSQPLLSWAADTQGGENTTTTSIEQTVDTPTVVVHANGTQSIVIQYENGTQYTIGQPNKDGTLTIIPSIPSYINGHDVPTCGTGGG
jgi:hypothetical protein